MKKSRKAMVGVFVLCFMIMGLVQPWTTLAKPPKMKMTMDIPESIIIPDKLESRIGTLEFFDGLPTDDTVKKAYDYLDFQRRVD